MKTRLNAPADCLSLLLVLAATNSLAADPRIDSWFTQNSGRYARIYQTAADESSGNATTTWSRGQGTQSLPVMQACAKSPPPRVGFIFAPVAWLAM